VRARRTPTTTSPVSSTPRRRSNRSTSRARRGRGRFLLAPLPLAAADPDLLRTEFASLSAAADAYYGVLAAGRAFRARREALAAIAKREARRAREIASKITRDLAEWSRPTATASSARRCSRA
jgi:hypothetical protein